MRKLLLLAVCLLLPALAHAGQVVDSLECSQFYDTVTIATEGTRVDATLSGGLYGGCVATPEGSVDGSAWASVPLKKNNSGPNVYALTSSNTATNWSWTFRNTGGTYVYFRLRISSFGSPGSRLVTLSTVP